MRERVRACLSVVALAAVSACGSSDSQHVLGTLERDRLELPAEANEPIVGIMVHEGEKVAQDQPLLQLDAANAGARRASLQASVGVARQKLTELVNGPRSDEVLEARARLEGAQSVYATAASEYNRVSELVARKLVSQTELDQQRALRDRAEATRREAQAQLTLLLKGTRIEQLDQAREALREAEAELAQFDISVARLLVRAPRNGVIEALPFKLGERPPAGAAVVVMLAEGAPYARVYVPEPMRVAVKAGSSARVHVDGVEEPFAGQVRYISADAAFTPYFALTQKDRSRLSYLAEVTLTEPRAAELPSGIPVEVSFEQHTAAAR
ncbi:MAG TPA: HlyD family efflux transporter periplasmic adaptor subunit [Steroidobacteraceae bacterium]|nr:HlyD family efflux transporter periplasmic adaptor subunit [Steroidobacteraceae bacterium]